MIQKSTPKYSFELSSCSTLRWGGGVQRWISFWLFLAHKNINRSKFERIDYWINYSNKWFSQMSTWSYMIRLINETMDDSKVTFMNTFSHEYFLSPSDEGTFTSENKVKGLLWQYTFTLYHYRYQYRIWCWKVQLLPLLIPSKITCKLHVWSSHHVICYNLDASWKLVCECSVTNVFVVYSCF